MDAQETTNEDGALEDQTLEEGNTKNPSCQQDSAYGSLESSSNGQSQKSFGGSGSKSLNSGSSHSSGFGDQIDLKGIRLHEVKHIVLKKKVGEQIAEKTSTTLSEEASSQNTEKKEEKSENLLQEVSVAKGDAIVGSEVSYSNPIDSCCEERDGNQTSLVYTQALNYIRKIKERSAEQGVPFASPHVGQLSSDRKDIADFFKSFISSRGFTVAISIQDGSVLQVSPSITDILGFPKDMLLGQSFIDFVYPKDSINFSSKIINGLNIPFRNSSIKDNYGTTFFCRLRMYHGLKKTGFGIRNKKTLYKPCKIMFKPQEASRFTETLGSDSIQSSLIIAEIIPIESAYKDNDEASSLGSFSIRHSASCNFSEYDPEAIPYLGHLPQDLTGNSIFDCYHPEDMKKLRSIYEEIVKHQGKPYRSEPYRFRTFNNSWVTLITEWLCFVNPWTKRIESIIGQHRVLKRPKDINIFNDPSYKNTTPMPEDIILEAQTAQNEILDLLMKPVTSYQDPSKEPMVKRRRTLANIMSPFVEELDNIEKKNTTDGQQSTLQVPYTSSRKSVGVSVANESPVSQPGASTQKAWNKQCHPGVPPSIITPGQESLNSSIETPSSYGQLNYSATLQRFFSSNPKTVSSDESGESKIEASQQESIGFSTSGSANRKSQSQSQSQSQSGSGSGSGDNNFEHNSFRKTNTKCKFGKNEGTSEGMSNDSRPYIQPLTEEILSRHNQNMQKQFMECQRRNERILSTTKYNHKPKSIKKLSKKTRERSYGLKRAGSTKGFEGNTTKYTHLNSSAGNSKESMHPSLMNTVKSSVPPNGGSKMGRPFPSPLLSRSTSDLPDGRGLPTGDCPNPYQRLMPNYYIPANNSSSVTSGDAIGHSAISSGTLSNVTRPFPAPPMMMATQPTYFHSQALPLQCMGGLPGIFYHPITPPLFNAPPVMLPNLVFQHTLVQPSVNHMSPPVLPEERKYGAESEQETLDNSLHTTKQNLQNDKQVTSIRRPDSQATSVKAEPGSVRGSNASASCKVNAAESLRSYVDDLSLLQNIAHSKPDRSQTPNFSQVSQFSQSTSVIAELESLRSPEKQEKLIEDTETRNYNSSDMSLSMDSSSSGPENKSLGDDSHGSNSSKEGKSENKESSKESSISALNKAGTSRPALTEPPWLDDIQVTPELLLRYQLQTNELVNVLRQDMDLLKKIKQPSCVEDQLASLYCELELDGESPELHLEEGITTSSSSDEQQGSNSRHHTPKTNSRHMFYSKIAMLHEEEAPMPTTRHDLSSSSSS